MEPASPSFPLRRFIGEESGLGFLDESLPQRQMGGALIGKGNLRDAHAGNRLQDKVEKLLAE